MWFMKMQNNLATKLLQAVFPLTACLLLTNIAHHDVNACSIYCPEGLRMCGFPSFDCSGHIGCFNDSTPCQGECPPSKPVLSNDGTRCLIPDCVEDTIWCTAEEKCKKKHDTCGGVCNSDDFPALSKNEKYCHACPPQMHYFVQDSTCKPDQEQSSERQPLVRALRKQTKETCRGKKCNKRNPAIVSNPSKPLPRARRPNNSNRG